MVTTYRKKPKTMPARYRPGFMSRMDGREVVTQALQAAYDSILDDLGEEEPSFLKCQLVERCCFLAWKLREIETGMILGKQSDEQLGRWIQMVNSLVGLSKTLGITKTAIDQSLDSLYTVSSSPQAAVNEKKPNAPKQKTSKPKRPSKPAKKKVETDDDDW